MPSTVIRSFSYIPEAETLEIVFVSGTVYHYRKVPVTIYEEMKDSFSKGIFFNENIKDKYEFERIETNKN